MKNRPKSQTFPRNLKLDPKPKSLPDIEPVAITIPKIHPKAENPPKI